jgi:hypothetical protein
MLDQITLPGPVGLDVAQQLADRIKLVEAGEDEEGRLFAAGAFVFFLDDAGVFLDNAAEALFG